MSPAFNPPLDIPEVASAFPHLAFRRAIGEGGQAPVFLVELQNATLGALKIYRVRDAIERRVAYEVAALKRLPSGRTVRLLEDGDIMIRGEDCLYVIYDYIDGEDLRAIINVGPVSEELTRRILCEIAEAIDELWALRIVHRDIKPENIMVSATTGSPVLIDLGIAKYLNESTLTATGLVWGTIGYMSPEQYRGQKRLSLKSDFFSLGIVTYEAYTGVHPFGRNQNHILTKQPQDVSEIRAVDTRLEAIMMQMLEKNPVGRPSSSRAIIGRI